MDSHDLSTVLIGFLLLVFILVEMHGASPGGAIMGGIPVTLAGAGIMIASLLGSVIGALAGVLSLGLPGLIAVLILLVLVRNTLPAVFTGGNYLVILVFFVFLMLIV